jgi:flagellar protein FliO/FliZ
MTRLVPLLLLLALAPSARAADTPPSALPAGSTMQMLLGLLLVLAAVVAAGWLARRFVPRHPAAGTALRVIAGTAVGQRERVVLVEVGSTWIVVGVAPGHVSALHTLPRMETPPAAAAPIEPQAAFSQWLRQFTEKRGGR